MDDRREIFTRIRALMLAYSPPLVSKRDDETQFDLWSTRPVVIEGRKRTEINFASLVLHKNHIGFNFMPVYSNPEAHRLFPPGLMHLLKGKACFHIKELDDDLLEQIRVALQTGIELYRKLGWC